MTETDGGLLSDAERSRLEAGELDAGEHRALDAEVHYRVRLLARGSASVDPEQLVSDVCLLESSGHNATGSMARARLAAHLPPEERP